MSLPQERERASDVWTVLGLERRPVIVALAGPNGAGKTTFYEAHLRDCGLRFLNADVFSRELGLDAYEAAAVVEGLRRQLTTQRESFVFETVFSDPVGDKLNWLKEMASQGYNVVLCFIGISGPKISDERVAMRVSQGGHDVPASKLVSRFPRTMVNLKMAIQELPVVTVFDNDDLARPFRHAATFQDGHAVWTGNPVPIWLRKLFGRTLP